MTAPLLVGDPQHLGSYTVTGRLGEGGQGVVYLGVSQSGQQVAIKLLRAQFSGNTRARSRFLRELSVAERVSGFCTAAVIDADMAGDQPYIVSEFVPGPALQDLPERLLEPDLRRLAIGTATALAAIHRDGIVHQDFKPANVIMAPGGPRVIDFGIARVLDADVTLTSQIVGTPAYMAPEQLSGEAIGPPAILPPVVTDGVRGDRAARVRGRYASVGDECDPARHPRPTRASCVAERSGCRLPGQRPTRQADRGTSTDATAGYGT